MDSFMLEMEGFKQDLAEVRRMIEETGKSLQIDHLREQLVEYREDMGSTGFWDDLERAQKVSAKAHGVERRIQHYESLITRADDVEVMMELADEEDDESMVGEIKKMFADLKEDLETMRLQTLLTGEYDACNCILSLHAGAGGTEAQDWTQMLYRMYTRFCERMGFTVRELDMLDGDEAGVKSVTFEVTGDYAYGYLKSERGVHRLVRISPFDANARRHTSFASLDVSPVIEDDGAIEIRPEDLRTGIVVQCQNERSQVQNKEMCFIWLRARLAELKEQQRQEQMGEIKGEMKKIEWGSQIRSYVFQPYTLVKDHRTGHEEGNISEVMDGKLEGFVIDYLQKL